MQHLQQGGVPSPLDRYNGARWAAISVDYLERIGKRSDVRAVAGPSISPASGLSSHGTLTHIVALRRRDGWRVIALKSVHRERLPPSDAHFSTNHLRVYTDDPDTMAVIGCLRAWRGARAREDAMWRTAANVLAAGRVARAQNGYTDQDVKLTPIRTLLPQADLLHRRPKQQWWQSIVPVLRLLASYDDVAA